MGVAVASIILLTFQLRSVLYACLTICGLQEIFSRIIYNNARAFSKRLPHYLILAFFARSKEVKMNTEDTQNLLATLNSRQ